MGYEPPRLDCLGFRRVEAVSGQWMSWDGESSFALSGFNGPIRGHL
jgi:hypothetical protein